MVTINEPGTALQAEHIDAFETKLGVRLPELYRKFSLQHNGGLPGADCD